MKSNFCLLSLHHWAAGSQPLAYAINSVTVGYMASLFFFLKNLLLIGFRSLPRHTGAALGDAPERLTPEHWRDCDLGGVQADRHEGR